MNFFNKKIVYAVIILAVGAGIGITAVQLNAMQQKATNKNPDNTYLQSAAGKKLKNDVQSASAGLRKEAIGIVMASNNASRRNKQHPEYLADLVAAKQNKSDIKTIRDLQNKILTLDVANRSEAFLNKVNNITRQVNASPLSAAGKKKLLAPAQEASDILGKIIIDIMTID